MANYFSPTFVEANLLISATMRWVLPTIVIAQFFCTSLWFAGNAILPDIIRNLHLEQEFLAHLTSAVQFGFITGTLVFAVLSIADRFSPSLVFFISSILAGLFNLGIIVEGVHTVELLGFRFLTGFFLAGIYPVGMKIASDYFQEGLGKSLGFLVGALVVGKAFPHLLRGISTNLPWIYVVYATSILAALGGIIMLLMVPDGPFRKPGKQLQLTAFLSGFSNKNFRAVAFGYFGHMWELYTFWALVPVMLAAYKNHYPDVVMNIPFLSFLVIASGGIACVFGGLLSQHFAARKLATIALFLSGCCCMVSPLFLLNSSPVMLMIFLFFWSLVVIADSPLFSTLVAQNAPEASRAASLTIVNSIGFTITIISIQSINLLSKYIAIQYVYMSLAIGPLLGLIAMFGSKNNATGSHKVIIK